MEWFWTSLIMLGMIVVAIVAITLFQRSMSKPGAHGNMGAMGGAISGLESVFNPHAAQAKLEREEQSRMRAPIPSPGDLPKGVRFQMDDDGVPTKVIIDSSALHPERDVKPIEGG
ncbi:hypothetical protein [Arthrobacter psychrolactophilus]